MCVNFLRDISPSWQVYLGCCFFSHLKKKSVFLLVQLAQKELQKINMYKAPRDKLVCILNCCKVINNLLLNASIASNENPPGADEFLPVLIYVTIKASTFIHGTHLLIAVTL